MKKLTEYHKYIKGKVPKARVNGIKTIDSDYHEMLKPHQRDICKWAVLGGQRAIFAAFGLGKSFMQLSCLNVLYKKLNGKYLIIAPLGVRQEFKRDAEKLGINITFVRRTEEVQDDGIYITNYESVRDGKLDVNIFTGTSLDEASVLRSYGSKTFQEFLQIFKTVKYRFVATATPSPNRYKELIHYAGFLGVMDTGQALTRFFQRDSTKANQLTLYPHKEAEFWLWVQSWAIFLQKPSDLGYDDTGYSLPKLHVHYHEVKTQDKITEDKYGQFGMFNDSALDLKSASTEKRESIDLRVEKAVEILKESPDKHFILWHDQEAERHAIKKALPEVKEVYGSQDLDLRENRILDFSDGKFKYLATKPILSGSGCNFQYHCHHAIYVGIGFKFNDFIQSVHRIYRFLQTEEVHIHIIHTDKERQILKTLQNKWSNHNKMVTKMQELIKKHGLSTIDMNAELRRAFGVERVETKGKLYTAIHNDCVEETARMEENIVDLIVTSIPFGNHYEYSANYNDFGHSSSNKEFFNQMDFLTPELLRVLRPGRIACIHVKDRINFGNVTGLGVPTVEPFHMHTAMNFIKHGFSYMGMITITTDVVRENNQTYRLGYSAMCEDSSKMGVGSPEYVLIFRKPQSDLTKGFADVRVAKEKHGDYSLARWQIDAAADWRSSGDRLMSTDEMAMLPIDVIGKVFKKQMMSGVYDYEAHVKLGEALDIKGALPYQFAALHPGHLDPDVWHDVNRMFTLNSSQSKKNQEKHICPLQFDIVDRCILRYSNPDDLVFDPFGGLGTVPYRAMKHGRRGMCVELNPVSYYDSLGYLDAMEKQISMPSLFDVIDAEVK